MEQPSSEPANHVLDPLPASIFASNEVQRRNGLKSLGGLDTGCPEIDEYLLQGGFERGCVVGVSADEEHDFGLTFGLQIIADALVNGRAKTCMLITPKPAVVVLPVLRTSISIALSQAEKTQDEMKDCLDRALLSCVFDVDGLWEVLADLDRPASKPVEEEGRPAEIADSQDSSSSEDENRRGETVKDDGKKPEIILVTHFGSLLTGLFTQRPNQAAHHALALLSSHLRYLSRILSSNPLIILLNSTSTASSPRDVPPKPSKPLDPTLRSIFAPPPSAQGYAGTSRHTNKPTFGLVFTQILDLHLLCTKLPRGRADADIVFGGVVGTAEYVTVVEVLLDEMGIWEGKRGSRKSREQRWAAVVVQDGRVVDAFVKGEEKVYGELRLAAGFGGRRL